jgi:hypothetical protein
MALTPVSGAKITQTQKADNWSTGTDNSSAVDMQEFGEVLVLLNAGTVGASGTVDVHVEESADGSTGWADITGAAFTQVTASNDDADYMGRVAWTATRERYLRTVLVVATAACDVGVSVLQLESAVQEVASNTAFNVVS